ncbi:hypothetical protein QTP70_003165 [Hemibagrus guttatus]|uniref:Reverse transcriptase/retrotransposon-derived protein RNase H-like domain-containing protein n=1 Tax=Hemibagrus guttatus TaxID=175788 RepID=A0AAE0QHP9_9TELE|nr:hypothetical protein QTP70_003165 [Hemibagrus guttatus]
MSDGHRQSTYQEGIPDMPNHTSLPFKLGCSTPRRYRCNVISSPKNPIILGFPWLQHHNPHVSWKEGELVRWLPHCIKNGLQDPISRLCLATSVESPAGVGAASIPREYNDLKEVFKGSPKDCPGLSRLDLPSSTSSRSSRLHQFSAIQGPGVPVVVEVDASSCGIGVVLYQCHGDHWKMHPCAYFSRKLTPAEANYDVGNRGSTGGMTTLFSVTYCPGTKNWKADALSHHHDPLCCPTQPEPILPSSIILAPTRWDLMEDI